VFQEGVVNCVRCFRTKSPGQGKRKKEIKKKDQELSIGVSEKLVTDSLANRISVEYDILVLESS
jgi:hypothetical protein